MNTPWTYEWSPQHRKVVILNGRGEVLMLCVAPFAERILAKRVCEVINATAQLAAVKRGRGRPVGAKDRVRRVSAPRLPGHVAKPR